MKTFRRRVADCGNAAELISLLADAAREIGFDYIAIVSAVGLQQHAPFIVRNDNYPEDWANHLIGGDRRLPAGAGTALYLRPGSAGGSRPFG